MSETTSEREFVREGGRERDRGLGERETGNERETGLREGDESEKRERGNECKQGSVCVTVCVCV